MKKMILLALVIVSAMSMDAAGYRGGRRSGGSDYTHSVGFKVGNEFGLTYKGFIFGVDGLALQADMGVKLQGTPYKGIAKDGEYKLEEEGGWSMYTFDVNPNVVYQKSVADFRNGSFHLYGGGGLSLGMAQTILGGFLVTADPTIYGKFGVNGVVGMELVFSRFILGLDFKPGYGLAFGDKYYISEGFMGVEGYQIDVDSNMRHFFDYGIGLSFKWQIGR